jgi:hypothetical protein
MSNSRYYIVGNNDVWMIQFKNTENGQYQSSNEATSFAIAVAQALGTRGEHAHVCVFDDDGHLRCKWSITQVRLRATNPA